MTNTTRTLITHTEQDDLNNLFIHACSSRTAPIIEASLKAGANVNVKDRLGWSMLTTFVWWEASELLELLLKYGADVNILTRGHRSPLFFAVKTRNFRITERLLQAGAKVDLQQIESVLPFDEGQRHRFMHLLLPYVVS